MINYTTPTIDAITQIFVDDMADKELKPLNDEWRFFSSDVITPFTFTLAW